MQNMELRTVNHLSRNISRSTQRKRLKRGKITIKRKRAEMRARMERLKADMEEISEGQKRIKKGQEEIRKRLEGIESECQKLKEETEDIAKQSDCNQARINLMFSILKARQNNNLAQADQLIQILREQMEQKRAKAGII